MDGGEGTYALYVNGTAFAGPAIRSQFAAARPTERAIPLDAPGTDVVIALRTFTRLSYSAWNFPCS